MANTLKFGNSEWYGTEGNILAYNDEGGNFKPLLFDFSRGSKATRVNQQGLIETVQANDARVDYKDNANGALLLEPTRTNLVSYSEDFSKSSWVKIGGTVSLSNSLSPDGTLNAYRFYYSNAQANTRIYQNHTLSAATYTFSVYAKKNGTNDKFKFSISDSSGQTLTPDFNLTDDWKRFEYTYTSSGGSGSWWLLNPSDTELGSEFDVLIYGAQLEQGSYATSYIPTQGTAQTRLADVCENNWNGLDVETESFSFYTEFNISAVNGVVVSKKQSLGANDGWALQLNSSGVLKLYVFANGTEKTAQYSGFNLNINHKVVGIIDRENDLLNLYVNGALKQSTDISAITGTLLSTYNLTIGSLGNGTAISNINTNSFNYYNNALTDQEAIALTQV